MFWEYKEVGMTAQMLFSTIFKNYLMEIVFSFNCTTVLLSVWFVTCGSFFNENNKNIIYNYVFEYFFRKYIVFIERTHSSVHLYISRKFWNMLELKSLGCGVHVTFSIELNDNSNWCIQYDRQLLLFINWFIPNKGIGCRR